MSNHDEKVIKDFGDEWTKFSYESLDEAKLKENFDQYFGIFPWDLLPKDAVGFDMGCGTGRWAKYVARKVKTLNCIEPSNAIIVAKQNLCDKKNIKYFKETTENCSLIPSSQDFGYCLGVLHHIPNTQEAMNDCTKLLKSGAPILLYLYYFYDYFSRPRSIRARNLSAADNILGPEPSATCIHHTHISTSHMQQCGGC